MITALWGMFPRLLEQRINGLLDESGPNALRAFHIYRACQHEGLWEDGIQTFSRKLEEFFARPRAERRKSHFDVFLNRPMDHTVYSMFHLDFRSAAVRDQSLLDIASWAHNLIRVSKKTTSAFVSLDVMTKTLRRITSPGPFEKARDIEFGDFCAAWKKTVFKLFGTEQDAEFDEILKELEWINTELKKSDERLLEQAHVPGIYLTQTELDWTTAVRTAALEDARIPKFPLSRGPDKQPLKELERVVELYMLSRTSKIPAIVNNRENIRATVLDRCDILLGKTKAAS